MRAGRIGEKRRRYRRKFLTMLCDIPQTRLITLSVTCTLSWSSKTCSPLWSSFEIKILPSSLTCFVNLVIPTNPSKPPTSSINPITSGPTSSISSDSHPKRVSLPGSLKRDAREWLSSRCRIGPRFRSISIESSSCWSVCAFSVYDWVLVGGRPEWLCCPGGDDNDGRGVCLVVVGRTSFLADLTGFTSCILDVLGRSGGRIRRCE